MEILQKLEALANLLEKQQMERLAKEGITLEVHAPNYKSRIVVGKKYAKIDLGTCGKLMVDMTTEEIFGIKGYGVVHKGHVYGTLDTIGDWYWGYYKPRKLEK